MTKKMAVDLMSKWVWVPIVSETSIGKFNIRQPDGQRIDVQQAILDIDEAFIEEYNNVRRKFEEMQIYLEHAYRHQQGMSKKEGSPF